MNVFGRFAQLIRHDNRIGFLARLIYCDLAEICTKEGACIVSNEYLSRVFNVPEIEIVYALGELYDMHIILLEATKTKVGTMKSVSVTEDNIQQETIKHKVGRIIYLNTDTKDVFNIRKKDLYDMWK